MNTEIRFLFIRNTVSGTSKEEREGNCENEIRLPVLQFCYNKYKQWLNNLWVCVTDVPAKMGPHCSWKFYVNTFFSLLQAFVCAVPPSWFSTSDRFCPEFPSTSVAKLGVKLKIPSSGGISEQQDGAPDWRLCLPMHSTWDHPPESILLQECSRNSDDGEGHPGSWRCTWCLRWKRTDKWIQKMLQWFANTLGKSTKKERENFCCPILNVLSGGNVF